MIQKLGPVYEGKRVFIDWKSGIGPAIYKQFQLPSGERLVHESPNPVFMPNYPGKNIKKMSFLSVQSLSMQCIMIL